MYHCYMEKRFHQGSLDLIETADEILTDFAERGFVVTLRTLYYQLVSENIILNTEAAYKRLGTTISDGRLAGLIDWEHLSDQTRYIRKRSHWTDPGDILKDVARHYAIDLWDSQDVRPEVWIEKDALIGIISDVCRELDVTHFSCRGYVSQSEMWRASQRILGYIASDHKPTILHFGDHDPSGLDMTRDIGERIALFCGQDIEVKRIALTYDQVLEFALPPNPAKVSDTRSKGYIEQFGLRSWELDALSPEFLVGMVRESVESLIDEDRFENSRAAEIRDKERLRKLSENYSL